MRNMRNMRCALLALVWSVFVCEWAEGASKCHDSDLRHCMDELKVLMTNEDLAFARSEHELNTACVHLQEAMRCVNDFTERCLDSTQRETYLTLTSGAQQLMVDFCTPGSSFREQYLEHSSCYKKLSFEYKQCSQNYLSQQEYARKTVKDEDRLKNSCCLFDSYKVCTRRAILEKCSVEAAELGELMITRASGPLVQTHCSGYRHNSPQCYVPDGATSISQSSYRLIVASLLVVFVLKLQRL